MPLCQVKNIAGQISSVPILDDDPKGLPLWRSRIKNVLKFQGVWDLVNGDLPRPHSNSLFHPARLEGYDPERSVEDWDLLSEAACLTINISLSMRLFSRYRETRPASKLFESIMAAFVSENQTPGQAPVTTHHPEPAQSADVDQLFVSQDEEDMAEILRRSDPIRVTRKRSARALDSLESLPSTFRIKVEHEDIHDAECGFEQDMIEGEGISVSSQSNAHRKGVNLSVKEEVDSKVDEEGNSVRKNFNFILL